MCPSPKDPIPWAVPLIALASLLATGCGPADESDPGRLQGGPPWGSGCSGGKCDGLEGVSLILCGPRDAATGRGGCTTPSAADIGIDPVISEKQVAFRAALDGLDEPGVSVALELADELGRIVRTLPVSDIRDGTRVVYWDGHDEAGRDVTAAMHTARLRASYGGDSIASEPQTIATLVNLPDPGPGYSHPRGTDRQDTDDWGRVHVVQALTDVGAAWSYDTPIAYLDLSLQNGGEFRPHWMHRHGECVDVRYVRNDGEGPLDLRWGQNDYDRQATQDLVDALVAHGAIEIYVDKRADLEGDFIVHATGHTNHFHANFSRIPGDDGSSRPTNDGRAGGPCLDDSDCNLREGFCLRPDETTEGVCTRSCDNECGDLVGGIYTLSECVETPDGRLCAPARDLEQYPDSQGCRGDLEPVSLASYDQGGAATDVCWRP